MRTRHRPVSAPRLLPTPGASAFPPRLKSIKWAGIVSACVLAAACGPSPTDPGGGSSTQAVATVEVVSAHGSMLDIGASMQLEARASDATGQAMSVPFEWSVDDTSIARVDGAGRVSALARGRTRVTATAGGRTGALEISVLDADLARVADLLGDPFGVVLIDGIADPDQARLRATWSDCSTASSNANLAAAAECAGELREVLAGMDGGSNRPLVALVGLIADAIERLLDLNS